MQDRLIKILTVKIEAINKNIDNLNYLNGELLKNNKDLDYINDKISIFKTKDILNFDKIILLLTKSPRRVIVFYFTSERRWGPTR